MAMEIERIRRSMAQIFSASYRCRLGAQLVNVHPNMPDACPSLQKANESRRRAWAELQKIRGLLALVANDLPPPEKPASFEAEGTALRAAMAHLILDLLKQLDDLDGAIAGMRPFFANPKGTSAYANVLITLNRATNRPRPAGQAIEKLRAFKHAVKADQ